MKITDIKLLAPVENAVSKLAMTVPENAPKIAVYVGVAGMVAGAVYAAVQARKLDKAVEEAKEIISSGKAESKQMAQPKATEYMVGTYFKASWRLVKVFAGPAGVIIISSGLILWGFKMIDGKLTVVTSALVASQASEAKAWEALKNEVGEEKANDIRYDMHTEEVETGTSEDGTPIVEKKKVHNDPKRPNYGPYAYLFDEVNIKRGYWDDDAWKHRMRLQAVEQALNNLKDSRENHVVLLNEALKMCGFKKLPKIGQFVGWRGNTYISLGLDKPWAKPFVDGVEPAVMLSFNCDGYVLDDCVHLEWGIPE